MKETLKIIGIFKLKVWTHLNDGSGMKVLFEEYKDCNKVVNTGKESILQLIGNAESVVNKKVSKIGFGTASSQPAVGDTALTDSYVKNLGLVTFPSINEISFAFELLTSEANGKAISEFGLLHEDEVLFSRKVRATINKESDLSFDGSWTLRI